MVVWGILSLLCVCFFVYTVTDFSAAEKARGVKFCLHDGLLSGQSSPFLVNFGSRGVTGTAAYVRVRGREMAREFLPTAATVGGHWESGAEALLKAVWWDLQAG